MYANVIDGHLLIEIRCLAVSNPKNPGLLDERFAFAITDAPEPQSGGPGTISCLSVTFRLVCAGDSPSPPCHLIKRVQGRLVYMC
jgi:hypothetical protein